MNIENLSDTIVAKSDQLNADDLIHAPRTIVVTGVNRYSENGEKAFAINYEGDTGRPFKPCKTVRRIILHGWGENGAQWIGRSMTLYCDPSVKWAGKEVGGIRISAMSDIPKPINVKLSATRGVKTAHTVNVLQVAEKPDYPDDAFNNNFAAWSDAVLSLKLTTEQLINRCESKGRLSDEQKKRIRDIPKDADVDLEIEEDDHA